MPIYEYLCRECGEEVSFLSTSISQAEREDANCPHCGGQKLERLISKVAFRSRGKGESPADANDSAALARTMRDASRRARTEHGEDFGEVANRLERGEGSTSIERSLRKRVGERMQPH